MKGKIAILILVSLVFSSAIFAQKTRELTQEDDNKKTSQKRIALVIGNGAYTKAKPLPNPSNDAADMAQTLRDLGFEVISGVNQNKRQTETLIREFGTKLAASGGIGLFYYAGHGIQVSGENYIVPVDADIPEEDEVAYSAVPISLVLSKMMTAKNDLNIVILDACRNNPFARSWRSFRDNSNSDGLAKISPPTGTLVLYATEPGKVASDGAGRNGLFTEALLKQIKKPNLEYDQLVKAVSTDVWQRSNKQQLPWKEGNSLADFYFVAKTEQKTNEVKNSSNEQIAIQPKPVVKENSDTKTTETKTAGTISKAVLLGGVEMSFAYIPAGSFEMGRIERSSMFPFREIPSHTVKISQGFWMQTTEVTQAQWKSVMGVFPSKCDSGELKGKFLGDNKPIICVSWDNAQEFIRQMNLKNDGYKYRLPTEAEWEYAARAGTTGDYAGDLDSMAWYYNNSGDQILSGEWNENKMKSNNNRMHEVATKQANAWGLYDMHGNVWEWCQDWEGTYPSGTVTDPTGATSGKYRVQRGGGWSLTADRLRSGVRFSSKPSQRHAYVGFRVVRMPL